MGKMRTPPEAPGGGKNIPRLAGGQVCQVLALAPTRMVLGCPDSSSALNTWLGYLHWGRSQRQAELYPGDLHWVTESSPQTLLLCRGAILIGDKRKGCYQNSHASLGYKKRNSAENETSDHAGLDLQEELRRHFLATHLRGI